MRCREGAKDTEIIFSAPERPADSADTSSFPKSGWLYLLYEWFPKL